MLTERQTRDRILVFGQDAMLLETRSHLIERINFSADRAATMDEFRVFMSSGEAYALVVLCQSLSEEQSDIANRILTTKSRVIPVFKLKGLTTPTAFLAEIERLADTRTDT